MFKKILARFGKGAATVDLRFENRPYIAGETIHGEVYIEGGEVEQKVNFLAVRLMISVGTKQGIETRQVANIPLSGAHVILPKEQKVIPFTYQIPESLPVSRGSISYYFDTELDIDGGVNRTDVDRLIIDVPQPVQILFESLGNLGFKEKPSSGKVDRHGQEFAFFPTQLFTGQVNEVELRFACEPSGVRVWMEIDCRTGFKEIEAKREFFIEQSLLQHESQVTNLLKQYITEAVENPHAYTQAFSYSSYQPHHSHGMGGMIGGLATGLLGGVLLSEMLDGIDDVIEEVAEAFGIDEEIFEDVEEALGFEDDSFEEEEDFDDFFDGGDGDW
ncbi:sporulation protein [Lysinibacillus sp. BW-2-10]|uniref:sporulation protein n=1 Tax=Lysinibacillus sp. BW-2-10 TaxID=2590030 RepID=UPI00117F0794|nr:sporulation protein [Lysinibacillus sp. BW-2-10]TSI09740.1 hypothetical protein FJQ64_05040 [Lysinibacillus sp. BW-2-10]